MSKEELRGEAMAPVEKVSGKEDAIQAKEETPEPISNIIDRLANYKLELESKGVSGADDYGKVLEQISNRSQEVTPAEALKIVNLNLEVAPFYVKNLSRDDMTWLIHKGFGERLANANKMFGPEAKIEQKRIAALEAEKAASAENLKKAYQHSQSASPVSPRNSQKVHIQPQKAKSFFQKIKRIFS